MKRFLFIILMSISTITVMARPTHLEVEMLFDGRYNTEKAVRISISRENGVYYRGLKITNNPQIINRIYQAIRADSSKAAKFFEQEGEGGKSTIMKIDSNGETIDVGLQQYNGNAYFFIKGTEKAFK